jgi:hypothetical protein
MMSAQREAWEVGELERIFALPNDAEETMLDHTNPETIRLLTAALDDTERIMRRAGKPGAWCFGCGYDAELAPCKCGFGSSFGCQNTRLCAGCREAHEYISRVLGKMFGAEVNSRINGVRNATYRNLWNAADDLSENEPPTKRSEALKLELAAAEPSEDDPRDFFRTITNAFRTSDFFAFQALAKALKTREDYELRNMLRKALDPRSATQKQADRIARCQMLGLAVINRGGSKKTGAVERIGRTKTRTTADGNDSSANPDAVSRYLKFRDGGR